MDVVVNIEQFDEKVNSAVTVGTFDGIHSGHQDIIGRLCETSARRNIKSALITFDPHPQTILNSKHKGYIKILTTVEEKSDIVGSFCVDYFIIIPFSKEFAGISSSSFIEDYLVKKFGAREIVIGYDHAFGKDRAGSIETLYALGDKHNFNVTVVEPVQYNGEKISSTRIRRVIKAGNVSEAAEMLGRCYALFGEVIRGKGIGTEISIPTANLKVNDERKLIPKNGIYIVRVSVRGERYNGLINIGTNPTFSYNDFSLEVNIFDFSEDIYGETIKVEFIERLRDEIKFESVDVLVEQIKEDKNKCIEFFNKYELNEE